MGKDGEGLIFKGSPLMLYHYANQPHGAAM